VGLFFPETALVFQAYLSLSINIHNNICCQAEDRHGSTLFEYLRDYAVHAGTPTKTAALSERDPDGHLGIQCLWERRFCTAERWSHGPEAVCIQTPV